MMKISKKVLSGVLAGLMLGTQMVIPASAADVRAYYQSEIDTSLREITYVANINWESGTYVASGGNQTAQEASDQIRAVTNFGAKKSLLFKAAEGYQLQLQIVKNNTLTINRKYGPTYSVPFGKWLDFGYFNVYKDRDYTIVVKSNDGSTLSPEQAKDVLKIYEVDNAHHIPEYYVDYIKEKADTINNLQDNPDTFSFVFITDTHIQHNQKHSTPLIRYLLNRCAINQVLGGGDWVTAWLSDADGIQGLWDDFDELRYLFADIPMIKNVGNHEWGFGSRNQWNISIAQAYNRFFREDAAKDNDIVYGKDKTYFYKDDKINKVRYVSLNCMDYPSSTNEVDYERNKTMWYEFSDDQVNWVKKEALDLPDDEWSCIFLSHVYILNKEENPWGDGADKFINMNTMRSVVSDFINRRGDMANSKGNFIAWLSGHRHADGMVKIDDFIHVIQDGDTCQKADKDGNQREFNDISEQSFAVYTVDKAKRKVYITKIGAGDDRSFTY